MPYITQEARLRIDRGGISGKKDAIIQLAERLENAGDLNYALTRIVQIYIAQNGGRYQQINDAIGALEGCKLELYRRQVAPYEDEKIEENGDV